VENPQRPTPAILSKQALEIAQRYVQMGPRSKSCCDRVKQENPQLHALILTHMENLSKKKW